MIRGIEILQAHRDQLAGENPRDPDLLVLDQWLDDGRTLAAGMPTEEKGGERLVLKSRIPNREKKVLKDFGASFRTLTGETIEGQKKAREEQGLPAFWYIVDAGDRERLLAVPSPRIEVAYFDKPEDFFVPGTFGKDTDTQEAMAAMDAKRYGLKGITQIVPEQASVFTELTFRHLEDHPGVWLFGPEYAKAQGKDWVYGRTKNSTNAAGSSVAYVGAAHPDSGLRVRDWLRDHGYDLVGTPRLAVAFETK